MIVYYIEWMRVRCPKCGTIPKIITSPRGERFTVSCECGYVFDSEMY